MGAGVTAVEVGGTMGAGAGVAAAVSCAEAELTVRTATAQREVESLAMICFRLEWVGDSVKSTWHAMPRADSHF